jgi:hypothetical protein
MMHGQTQIKLPGFIPGIRNPSSNWIGGRVGLRAEMDIEEKKTVLPLAI